MIEITPVLEVCPITPRDGGSSYRLEQAKRRRGDRPAGKGKPS